MFSLLELQFQASHQHTARRIEGILAIRGVYAAVNAVENVVDADAGLNTLNIEL